MDEDEAPDLDVCGFQDVKQCGSTSRGAGET